MGWTNEGRGWQSHITSIPTSSYLFLCPQFFLLIFFLWGGTNWNINPLLVGRTKNFRETFLDMAWWMWDKDLPRSRQRDTPDVTVWGGRKKCTKMDLAVGDVKWHCMYEWCFNPSSFVTWVGLRRKPRFNLTKCLGRLFLLSRYLTRHLLCLHSTKSHVFILVWSIPSTEASNFHEVERKGEKCKNWEIGPPFSLSKSACAKPPSLRPDK